MSINPKNIKMCSTAVVLNEFMSGAGIPMKEKVLLSNPNLWHKIIVQNCEDLDRDSILKTILDDVHPRDFIPVCFVADKSTASFFVRNCRQAIEKLHRQHLIVMNPFNKDNPFKLKIILAYSNTSELFINVQSNILNVLTKRYKPSSKTMNLDSFYKDPDLTQFCTFSQPKILYFVLYLSKQFQIQILRLTNNDIHILSPIESLWGMKSLTVLDLRNNMIEEMVELNILKTMQITELYLDGNPVCDLYDEYTYVQAVKEVCPKIEKLDGVLLGQNGFLAFRRNFLCDTEAQELVDQFLEHYFTLYDNGDRPVLEGFYHKHAMFSITSQYLPGQSTTATANLGRYKCASRNLRLLSDLARSEEFLFQGSSNIAKLQTSLPPTEHDPYTFTVDLMYYTEAAAIITVTGVFREVSQSLLESELILGFTRTFVLLAAVNGEYNIVNEQLHISNATTVQQQKAFKIVRVPRPSHFVIEQAQNVQEQKEMARAFKSITNLNMEWSKKCLEDCKYDLRSALTLFVELHKADRIPSAAFISSN